MKQIWPFLTSNSMKSKQAFSYILTTLRKMIKTQQQKTKGNVNTNI